MKCILLTGNNKFAILAVLLGVIAIFGGNPQTSSRASVDTKELALQIENKSDLISVEVLAGWIIQEKQDFRLIDLRGEEAFNEYHIPVAENIKVTQFNDFDMPKNGKYLLFSDSDIESGQAWSLLKAKGYKAVYIVNGGLGEWKSKILFPKLAMNSNQEEIAAFEKMKAISAFFGGNPQVLDSASTAQEIKMDLPKPGGQTQAPVTKKKKLAKEGC